MNSFLKIFALFVLLLGGISADVMSQYTQTTGSINACSGTFFDSGGSGLNYGNFENSVFTICSSASNCVQVNFTSFSLESGFDYLEIRDGNSASSPLIGTYTGSTSPGLVTSTSGCLTFVFSSDGSVTYPGWQATISCTSCPAPPSCLPFIGNCNETACSGSFYDSGGPFASYGNNESFTHTICGNVGLCLTMTFSAFSLESGFDFLTIYDGPNTGSPLIGTYTGFTSPGAVTSTSGCLTFVFTSDGSVTSSGWEATLSCATCPTPSCLPNIGNCTETACSGNFYDSGGSFGSYSNNESFTHTICGSPGQCISVAFSSFSTESGFDYLDIYDGPNTSSTLIGSYTGSNSPGTVTSSTGCLTFVFTSDGSVTSSGWQATLSCGSCSNGPCLPNMGNCLDNTCSGNFYDSGGAGGNYGNNENFVHTICSNSSNCVNVNFSSFDLETGFDILRIYDGGSTGAALIGTYTGTTIPGTINGSTGCLTFEFISDGSVTRPGWQASISCSTCPVLTGCLIDPVSNGHGFPSGFTQACDDLCSSSALPLGFTYDICGLNYSSMYVNMNGNITFGASYATFTPVGMPNNTTAVMVAPFWADVDTRSCGTVYYQNNGTNAIVTWYNVGYYSSHCDKLNTFQLVLSNGADPLIGLGNNTAFYYDDMNWTTGDVTGFGGFSGAPATAGVNANDGINYSAIGRFDQPGTMYDGAGGNTDGVDYLDNRCFTFPAAGCAVFPFSLLKLEAETVENSFINLKWSTNTRFNDGSFEIQRSLDGQTFESIGFISGSGRQANALVDYAFPDHDVQRNVDYYYRIAQTDPAGKTEISTVVYARISDHAAEAGKAFPNPFEQTVSFELRAHQAGNCEVRIRSVSGKILKTFTEEVLEGAQQIHLDLEGLASGLYLMEVRMNDELISVQKLAK